MDVALLDGRRESESPMFWNKKKTVRVLFVDAATGATFAQTNSQTEQLPESFEAHTTVNVQGQEWEVLSATPVTRAEFTKAGELRLNVRKLNVQKIPPGEILFSLPTICDGIPGIAKGTSKLGKDVLELHEDDWRQVELISVTHLDEARSCLAKIERIYAEERMPSGGFKKLHVRSELAAPIVQNGLTLSTLKSTLSPRCGALRRHLLPGRGGTHRRRLRVSSRINGRIRHRGRRGRHHRWTRGQQQRPRSRSRRSKLGEPAPWKRSRLD
jgi:hypothetical protein